METACIRGCIPSNLPRPRTPSLTGRVCGFTTRAARDVPADKVIQVDRVFVDGGRRVWEGRPDELLRAVRIEKKWPAV